MLRPFDRLYESVTRLVRGHVAERRPPLAEGERAWLLALVEEFYAERLLWSEERYAAYVSRMARFRPRALRLCLGAFLHIAYDLPRVIADHWPGASGTGLTLDEVRSQYLYFELDGLLGPAISEVAAHRDVLGLLAVTGRIPIAKRAMGTLMFWALSLRAHAWLHARALGGADGTRADVERAMLQAVEAALDHVVERDVPSWMVRSPRLDVAACLLLPCLAVGAVGPIALAAAAGILAVSGAAVLLRRRGRVERVIGELGARVHAYVAEAVERPATLSTFLAEARREPTFVPRLLRDRSPVSP
jgi:hypothetical protein